jgi:nucleoside 2-deoxyribosyltransferase
MGKSNQKKIYIAGPEVFLPNAIDIFLKLKELCTQYNFIGLSPFDSVIEISNLVENTSLDTARSIFIGNANLILNSDIVIANCNSFRGPLVDDGTSWEIGYAYGLGKKLVGYINNKNPLVENVKNRITTIPHPSGFSIDMDGYLVNENFGNSINLMLEFSIEKMGGKLIEGDFEDCLKFLKNNIE